MDRQLFEQLYRTQGPTVLRRAEEMLGNRQDAQEAMQEVFIICYRKWDTFQGRSSTTTWLYRITTNHCLNKLRSAKRRREVPIEQDARDISAPHVELKRLVRSILQRVPEQEARAAVYHYYDEMNQEEIAPLLGCSRRKVGYLLERFAGRARKFMCTQGGAP